MNGRLRASVLFGALLSTRCVEAAPSTTGAPSFARIEKQILAERCTAACHSGGEFAAGGLDLGVDSYTALVGAAPTAVQCGGVTMPRVVPGKPDESLLYALLVAKAEGTTPPCGDAMPQGANRPALTPEELESVRAWIAAGAKND